MNLCPRSGRLGSLLIYHRPFNTGNQGSILCLGTNGRPSLTILGVTSLGCFVVGEP